MATIRRAEGYGAHFSSVVELNEEVEAAGATIEEIGDIVAEAIGDGFIGLGDTPASYAGSAGYRVTVNIAEDALEFTPVPAGGGEVDSVFGRSGAVVAVASDYSAFYAPASIQAAVDLNTAKVSNVDHPLVETAVPVGAVFTDTVYDDTVIQAAVALNTAKVSNVDHPLVETAVPLGAVFTDTVYDDTAIQAAVALNTAKVSNVDHPLVETAVPLGALFTDTVYDDTAIQTAVSDIAIDQINHEARIDNPHAVTAAQVGSYTTAEVDALLPAPVVTSTVIWKDEVTPTQLCLVDNVPEIITYSGNPTINAGVSVDTVTGEMTIVNAVSTLDVDLSLELVRNTGGGGIAVWGVYLESWDGLAWNIEDTTIRYMAFDSAATGNVIPLHFSWSAVNVAAGTKFRFAQVCDNTVKNVGILTAAPFGLPAAPGAVLNIKSR